MARADPDTDIGGQRGSFPATRHSMVSAAASADAETRSRAFGALVAGYWKPVYKYLRIRWRLSNEDAKDLTQGFFARALEKGFFAAFDPARGRFRTFLRTCVDRFAANVRQAETRVKRGGETTILPLDFESAEGELRRHEAAADGDLEEMFEREWARSLFARAVEDLRARCAAAGRPVRSALFERYDVEGAEDASRRPTYEELGREFGLPASQVTNELAAARREFRRSVLRLLRSETASEEEFRLEVKSLLGGGA